MQYNKDSNKLEVVKQFLLPGCECYCNAAPIPFDEMCIRDRLSPVPCKAVQKIPDGVVLILLSLIHI